MRTQPAGASRRLGFVGALVARGEAGRTGGYNAGVRQNSSRVWLSVLVVVGGLLAGLLLAAVWAAPRVEQVVPSTTAPSTSSLRLTFTRPMDQASVESAFSVDPDRSGSLRWIDNTLVFTPARPWEEQTVVTSRLAGGARSQRGLPLIGARAWSFRVGAPRLLYLWPSGGNADLYAATLDASEAERLTASEHGVREYTVGGMGSVVVYAAVRPDGQVDFWQLDLAGGDDRLLYACPANSQCGSPALSEDGEQLAFEQADTRPGPGAEPVKGMRRVVILPMAGGDPVRVSPEDHQAMLPAWAPDGKLAYYDGTLRASVVVLPVDGAAGEVVAYVPNDLGLTGAWAADASFLVFPEIAFLTEPESDAALHSEETEGAFYSHLVRAQVPSLAITDLSAQSERLVEDASPALSPDGEWLAFARKHLDRERWTQGRQLWLARPDGTQARQLLDEPAYNHSALVWSADSRRLGYMRLNQADLGQPPDVYVFDLQTGMAQPVRERGYAPQWLP